DDLDLASVVAVVVRNDADVDDTRLRRPIAVEFDRIEADHEHEIARIDVVEEERGAEPLDRPEEERVVLTEHALRFRAHHHWNALAFRETPERARGAWIGG